MPLLTHKMFLEDIKCIFARSANRNFFYCANRNMFFKEFCKRQARQNWKTFAERF